MPKFGHAKIVKQKSIFIVVDRLTDEVIGWSRDVQDAEEIAEEWNIQKRGMTIPKRRRK